MTDHRIHTHNGSICESQSLKKNSGLNRIRTRHDLCDTGEVRSLPTELSSQLAAGHVAVTGFQMMIRLNLKTSKIRPSKPMILEVILLPFV